ncbi:hypothetical protein CcaverHIS002_0506400 [Cutaneotrichosporon cavernicola]|uniref:Annexin n=1 Tax=Cutaneotrichosporon cavernicola TaxID=279322 RepID=A0AA48L6U1_9TREE|nr:uncharacterized protein CcaverHIS019_0506920 [Cutaneotrichosporon cavernicola]BEI85239.1 hypothetical protein CcaverHIS002_0506400 [Cutaneotrichosporon cavernicola]BEI93064.1 hypothetical protein CcaverHIS019_0506920 [Cutaneotrichosporon cavernicola]BEJ00841.1 hypothetical protein CcaverHIS631_0506980 [Cutaneotrichosporon cavernicola]BEJ08608.1 hypothetical protein CcaverHIS641_0507020 [Cutaneotrichosporon cavernicola]
MYGGGYNQQQPYGQQPNQYGAPQAQYGAPANQYGAPQANQYGAPPANQYGAPPAGAYGAAPTQQYGAPQTQYGAPANQYGAPQTQYGAPANQYGSPPTQYGSPPTQYGAPQTQYGAPPQQSYAAPAQQPYGQQSYGQQPYGQQQQYGQQSYNPPGQYGNPAGGYQAQPAFTPSSGGPRFLGVQIPAPPPAPPLSNLPNYNPQFDADRIRKATKGFGTDEDTVINVMMPLDAFQVDVLSRTFEQQNGRSLMITIEKEMSGWLEYILRLKSLGPLGGDLWLIHRAGKGMGTHEDLLNETLLCRSNEEMFLLKEGFRRMYNKDLVSFIRGELSMKTERMFNMALSGTRDENPMVNHQQVQQDIETLYRAGPGKIGTDEISICGILLQRSNQHLQALAQGFTQRHGLTLSKMIEKEFSGHMRDGLLHISRFAETDGNGVYRDAKLLEAAMAGMGTKDERLCYRLCRMHWDRQRFGLVKNQYRQLYRRDLVARVKGETSGKYQNALVSLISQN